MKVHDDEEAEAILLKNIESSSSMSRSERADAIHNLGCLYASQLRFQEAEERMNSALQLRKMEQEKAEGEGDLRTTSLAMAESLNDLGVVLSSINSRTYVVKVRRAGAHASAISAIYPSSAHRLPPKPRAAAVQDESCDWDQHVPQCNSRRRGGWQCARSSRGCHRLW